MTETLTGGCLCGAVRYRAAPHETLPYICHCADCRRYGGGPFHAAIVVAAPDLTIEGKPRVWTKTADSGREIARYFCGACGGHLFTSPWPVATRFSIKAGTLDDPGAFAAKAEIWARGRAIWAAPDVQSYEKGFTDPVTIGG